MKNHDIHNRSKHIAPGNHHRKEFLNKREINVIYVESRRQLADFPTKENSMNQIGRILWKKTTRGDAR